MKLFLTPLYGVFLALVAACAHAVPAHLPKPAWDKPMFGEESDALAYALRQSCNKFNRMPAGKQLHTNPVFGTAGQWQGICKEALAKPENQLVGYLKNRLVKVAMPKTQHSKFTGYFKPLLKGSLTRQGPYQTPVVAKPKNLVVCKGKSGIKLPDGTCTNPYPSRAEIENNISQYKAIAWVADPIAFYFMQIQGSGTLELENGQQLHVGFAAKNGREYVAIGKVMKERGLIQAPVNADKIIAWMKANPVAAREVVQTNPSYIFFALHDEESPGAFGVQLVPGRSLAVDKSHYPLGVPIYVDTTATHAGVKWRRIMFAHDIGSAIQGPTRGDIYFGHGADAGRFAGDQNAGGTAYAMVPRENVNLNVAKVVQNVQPAAGPVQ
jgi:membrane-bound lytic murein transglycosylase A